MDKDATGRQTDGTTNEWTHPLTDMPVAIECPTIVLASRVAGHGHDDAQHFAAFGDGDGDAIAPASRTHFRRCSYEILEQDVDDARRGGHADLNVLDCRIVIDSGSKIHI